MVAVGSLWRGEWITGMPWDASWTGSRSDPQEAPWIGILGDTVPGEWGTRGLLDGMGSPFIKYLPALYRHTLDLGRKSESKGCILVSADLKIKLRIAAAVDVCRFCLRSTPVQNCSYVSLSWRCPCGGTWAALPMYPVHTCLLPTLTPLQALSSHLPH